MKPQALLLTACLTFAPTLVQPAQADGFKKNCSTIHNNARGHVVVVDKSTFEIDGKVRAIAARHKANRANIHFCSYGSKNQSVVTGLTEQVAKEISGTTCKELNRQTDDKGQCQNVGWVNSQ